MLGCREGEEEEDTLSWEQRDSNASDLITVSERHVVGPVRCLCLPSRRLFCY